MEIQFSKSFSKWLSKYSHHLFRISRQPNIDSENDSLECKQDIEKLLESENIQRGIFMYITLQMMIQRVKFRKTLRDALTLCDLCILQRPESVAHIFLRCNFAKACWASIAVVVITTRPLLSIFKQIKDKLQVPFFMEIIILMSQSIWVTRNNCIFKNLDPSVDGFKRAFIAEMFLLLHRVKREMTTHINTWLQSL